MQPAATPLSPTIVNRSCTASLDWNRASRIGPLSLIRPRPAKEGHLPTSGDVALTCEFEAELEPGGCACQSAQLLRLKRGPSPDVPYRVRQSGSARRGKTC